MRIPVSRVLATVAAVLTLTVCVPAAPHVEPPVVVPAPAPVPQAPLLSATDLRWAGAFRVPTAAKLDYDHSGHGLTYRAATNTLLASNFNEEVSEFTIPTPGTGPTVASLPRASLVQGPKKINISGAGLDQIGGLLVDGSDLIVAGYRLYDANGSSRLSHYRVPLDFSQSGALGPVQVAGRGAGWVGGPMARIPDEWQALLGGPYLTSLCCVSIADRTSAGPTATVFDPADLVAGVTQIPGTLLLGYPRGNRTLGEWNSSGTLYNAATEMAGLVWVEGTGTILYLGRKGDRYCYGDGSACGDPTSAAKGDHAYPYEYFVWAYSAYDLLDVKRGVKQPWEVLPYATWAMTWPIQTAHKTVRGLGYDPATQTIYAAEQRADGPYVLIHALQVSAPTDPTTPPAPRPVDCAVSAWDVWSTWVPDGPAFLTESRSRTRTVTTDPAHGGASCPALLETETRDIADSDGDGVNDYHDLCPNTPAGMAVDANGCLLPPRPPDYAAELAALTEAVTDVHDAAAAHALALASADGALGAVSSAVQALGTTTVMSGTGAPWAALQQAVAAADAARQALDAAQAQLDGARQQLDQAVAALVAKIGGG